MDDLEIIPSCNTSDNEIDLPPFSFEEQEIDFKKADDVPTKTELDYINGILAIGQEENQND